MNRLLILLLTVVAVAQTCPIVHTRLGAVEGFEYENTFGDTSEIFLNIPYAQPPVGDLRFEKPLPVEAWNATGTLNATAWGHACIPHDRRGIAPGDTASEDCLNLNIIRPKYPYDIHEKMPVLVWIHGGGYEIGYEKQFGYKGFANIYNPENIVVVTIQYRLGVLGFFSNGETDLPGNLGLWDQALAFKWIHENIDSFNGDPNQVTAWGLSAGGGSASELSLSPHSAPYISGTIEQSGSSFAHWAIGADVPTKSVELAVTLNCTDFATMKSCLKSKTVEEFYDAVDIVGSADETLNCVKWGPRLDQDFFPDHPSELVKTAPRIPALVGVADREGAFFGVMNVLPEIHRLGVNASLLSHFTRFHLRKQLEKLIEPYMEIEQTEQIVEDVIEWYTSDRCTVEKYDANFIDNGYYLDKYSMILGDLMFIIASARSIRKKADAGWTVYAYSMDHYNEAIWPAQYPPMVHGAPHTSEYPYMFEVSILGDYEISNNVTNEMVVRDIFQESIISFTKTGVPRSRWVKLWLPVGVDNMFLTINRYPILKRHFYTDRRLFWHDMLVKYNFDLVSATTVVDVDLY